MFREKEEFVSTTRYLERGGSRLGHDIVGRNWSVGSLIGMRPTTTASSTAAPQMAKCLVFAVLLMKDFEGISTGIFLAPGDLNRGVEIAAVPPGEKER